MAVTQLAESLNAADRPTLSPGLRQRLVRGLGATALNPVVTAIIQLGTVPLLLHAWGAAKYGDWIMLSAVPSYLSLANLGFGDASASDMTMRVAAGDREGALETFQSSWTLLLVMSAALLAAVSSAVWHVPWQHWMHLSSLSDAQASAVIVVFSAHIIVSQQCGVLESGFRCDGHFASGTFWGTVMRLVEATLGCLAGILTGQLLYAALAYLVSRIIGTVSYAVLLRHKSPWLRLGFKHARLGKMKKLSAPALGFLALPLGYSISIQGFTLLIGFLKGPVAVTMFSTLRTMTRVNFQLMTTIGWALWPELSSAFGKGNTGLARTLHRHAYQIALVVSVLTGSLLWFLGPFIYRAWIRHAVAFDATCFHILLLVTVLNSLWFMSSVVPMSANAHHRLAFAFVAVSSISLWLAWPLVSQFGIAGAAGALLVVDGCMSGLVLRTSLRQLQDTLASFLLSLWTFPRFWRPARIHGEA